MSTNFQSSGVVNLLRNCVVNFNRGRWLVYSALSRSIIDNNINFVYVIGNEPNLYINADMFMMVLLSLDLIKIHKQTGNEEQINEIIAHTRCSIFRLVKLH